MFFTKREKDMLECLTTGGVVTRSVISQQLGIKDRQISILMSALEKKGIHIQKQKATSNGETEYSITKKEFETPPSLVKDFTTDYSYGKALLSDVTQISETITKRWIKEIPIYKFKDTIGIIFLADFHIGHPHTDYRALVELIDEIAATPNLYVVTLGDLIDNSMNAHAPVGTYNIIDKAGQLDIIEYLFTKLKDKILIMYEGNHELRSFLTDHFLVSDYLSKGINSEYGKYGGLFVIEMNGEPIKIYCRHKCPGSNNQYNPLHSLIRAILFNFPEYCNDADVLVRAHTHERATGCIKVGHKYRYLAVCGTACSYDEYADRVGYVTKKSSFPILIIQKDGEMFWVDKSLQGIEILKKLGDPDGMQ